MGTIETVAILLTIVLNAMAQIFLRIGVRDLDIGGMLTGKQYVPLALAVVNLHVVAGLACYVVSVITWIYVLSKMPVSTAYPMMSMAYVVGALMGWYLLGESLSTGKIAGVGVICIGIWILASAA